MIKNMLDKYTENKLAKRLYDAAYNEKVLDIYAIRDIIIDIDDYKNIEKYLENIVIKQLDDSKASYSYAYKTICIDLDWIKKQDTDVLSKNILLLDAILHEVDHIFLYDYENSFDDMKSKLLKANFDFFFRDSNNLTGSLKTDEYFNKMIKKACLEASSKMYSCLPSERLAYYDANIELCNILKIAYGSDARELITKNSLYTFDTLSYDYTGYNYINSPLGFFQIIHDSMPFFKPIRKYIDVSDLSLNEKFAFGFPLSKTDFKKLKINYAYPD